MLLKAGTYAPFTARCGIDNLNPNQSRRASVCQTDQRKEGGRMMIPFIKKMPFDGYSSLRIEDKGQVRFNGKVLVELQK